jgi:pentatricopeptide repeat protein
MKHVSHSMWSNAVRGLNFFSPKRKALRDSAFRIRIAKLKEQKLERRARQLESAAPIYLPECSEALKFSNEESLRKNPRLRRMITRPTAELPRRHYLFIKNGSVPLSIEDLSKPGKSVFDESKMGEILKEKSRETGGKPDSWLFEKSPKKGIKKIEWKGPSADKPEESTNKQENMVRKILGPDPSATPLKELSTGSTAGNLISTLKEKALVYSQTGINPDLMESVRAALEQHPGLERRRRHEDLLNCPHTVDSLVSSGLASVENFNLLIRSMSVRKNFTAQDAFSVVDSMISLGYDPDDETFVSLMIVSGSNAELARSAYLRMRALLIPPTEKVYGALIKAHVRAGDLPSGFSLLRKMEDEGLVPSSPVVYTTLLDGLVKTNKLEIAWERFHNWRTWKNVKPDTVMFTVMIRACTKKQECEKALGILDDLRVSGEYPTDITYSHLIECMATRSDFAERAFEFRDQMLLEGFELNAIVAKSLVKACAALGDLSKLKRTVSEITAANIPLTRSMYADFIRTVAKSISDTRPSKNTINQNLRLVWYFVADLKEKNVSAVSPDILNALLETYCSADLLDQAIQMLEQFSEFSLAPNAKTYDLLLELLGKRQEVGRFFALYEQSKNMCSERIVHLALDLAMESRSSKQTVSVLEDMLNRKIRPLPAAAERLAIVGRQVVQIHQVVGRMVAQQRDETHERTTKEHALLALELEEHRTRIAHVEGKTDFQFETPENEARRLYWDKKDSGRKTVKLAKKDWIEVKKKGGRMHALKVDKPKPNLLA